MDRVREIIKKMRQKPVLKWLLFTPDYNEVVNKVKVKRQGHFLARGIAAWIVVVIFIIGVTTAIF